MRSVVRVSLLMLVMVLCLAGRPRDGRFRAAGGAQPPRTAIERWNQMSEYQRRRALERLPPERRRQLRERMDNFRKLPPRERQRLRQRYQQFRQLPPARQQQLRQSWQQYRNLPDYRRQDVYQELQILRGMPGDARQQRMNSPAFRDRYTPSEQQMLRELSQVPP